MKQQLKLYQNLPKILRDKDQWVGVKNGSKIPFIIGESEECASSTDSTTWENFAYACSDIEKGNFDYLGYVFNDDNIVGIDLDDAFFNDAPTGVANEIISVCNSYTEESVSGNGLHIFVKGNIPFKGLNNGNGVEIYKTARYFVMTGKTLGVNADIVENQSAIDYVLDTYFSNIKTNKNIKIRDRLYTYNKPTKDVINLIPVYLPIPNGSRHVSLLSIGGTFHSVGNSMDYVENEVRRANEEACEEPLSERELQNILNSLKKYERG